MGSLGQSKGDIATRQDIERLVDAFYREVLNDKVISHFFTDVVKLDWAVHIPRMYAFWESVLFGGDGFKGNPMAVHIQLDKKSSLLQVHFERWLQLWETTIRDHFEGQKAEEAIERAQQIAAVMRYKVESQRNS